MPEVSFLSLLSFYLSVFPLLSAINCESGNTENYIYLNRMKLLLSYPSLRRSLTTRIIRKSLLSNILTGYQSSSVLKRSFSSKGNIRDEIFDVLNLQKFSDAELHNSFHALKREPADEFIHVQNGFQRLYAEKFPLLILDERKLASINKAILGSKTPEKHEINYEEYKQKITHLAEKLDKRVYNIGFSFLLTGISVGVIIPCMPLLVSQLEISPNAFGIVISAFGLSRLLGNIPSGFLVEKYGRKASVTGGLIVCGLANFSISFILLPGLGTPWLVFCRFLAGLGVSGFIAGGQMIISDISTHLNRSRTLAPVMAAFSAGMALGPAIGGFLIDMIGLSQTYALVGGAFALIALNNQLTMSETKRSQLIAPTPVVPNPLNIPSPSPASTSSLAVTQENTIIPTDTAEKISFRQEFQNSYKTAMNSWSQLLQYPKIRNLVVFNGLIWFSMAGAQFTLLPLHLVSDQFHFTSFEIGYCFAYSSIVAFLTSQPVAYLSDKFGKTNVLLLGTGLVASSILSLPFTENMFQLLATLTPLSVGLTAISTSVPALMTDLTKVAERAQGLALLRMSGDLGFLFGASFSGLIASYSSLSSAFLVDGSAIMAGMTWFMIQRNILRQKLKREKEEAENQKKKIQ
jgi:MFS family permease